MYNTNREKINTEKILKDFHIKRKIFSLFLIVLFAVISFGISIVGSEHDYHGVYRTEFSVFLLVSMIIISILSFRSARNTFESYFKIKERKYSIIKTRIFIKSFSGSRGPRWIKTELDLKENIMVDNKTYNSIHCGEDIFIILLDEKIIGIYSKEKYYLDYVDMAELRKKGSVNHPPLKL